MQKIIKLTPIGLYCEKYNFYLDPKRPVEHAVISHAHADHAVPNSHNVYCTAPTKAFMELRYGHKSAKEYHLFEYQEQFSINGAKITFYSAGHILGSAQILIEIDGIRFLYTGDIKMEPDDTVEPIQFVQADILITETTFANPSYIHPSANEEIKKLNQWQGINIIFGAYALGKAQRITKLINKYVENKSVFIHNSIAPINKIYEQFGINLGLWELYERRKAKYLTNSVYIVPPLSFSGYTYRTDIKKVFASGWSNLQESCDDKIFISDHIDWMQFQKLVSFVQPKEIWTLHGDGSAVKKHYSATHNVLVLNQ